jgi:cytochrome P450
MTTLQDVSRLADPAVLPDPYPVLAALREASPLPGAGGAVVLIARHRDCSAILRDPLASSERTRSALVRAQAPRARTFLSMDPPDHTRLRGLVSKAFTPRVVSQLAPRIRELTGDLLDEAAAAGTGEFDLVSQLAYPLPVQIICELLGVPAGDRAVFAGWSAAIADGLQPQLSMADSGRAAASAQAWQEFDGYFGELITARRANPAGDLLSGLIAAEENGEHLTAQEIVSTCVLLLVAGHETTVSLISNAVLALLRHPGQLAALRADPGLAAGAVEETLRYDAPVQLSGRVARGDIRIGDVTAADGTMLLLLLAAAGRDPDVFPDPDRFDIRRGAASHLAFAAGPHFCLGAPLARLEATIALQEFASRLMSPELDPAGLAYKPNLNLRGPSRMIVGFAAPQAR